MAVIAEQITQGTIEGAKKPNDIGSLMALAAHHHIIDNHDPVYGTLSGFEIAVHTIDPFRVVYDPRGVNYHSPTSIYSTPTELELGVRKLERDADCMPEELGLLLLEQADVIRTWLKTRTNQ